MNRFFSRYNLMAFVLVALFTGSCSEDETNDDATHEPYVLSLGVTSSNATSYYVVTTDDLMTGTISPVGNGIEQTGYFDYEQGGNTIFSIGGMGVTNVYGITRNGFGDLQLGGNFVFDNNISDLHQVDAETMLAIDMPASPQVSDQFMFYKVSIADVSITEKVSRPVSELTTVDWPYFTGMRAHGNRLYVTYMLMDPTTWATQHTDEMMVAVYSWPELELIRIMKDTRTGPAGSWNAYNGIVKDESGNLFVMSNTAIANGYSQSTKAAGFLRIPAGTEVFDPEYFFDIEETTGGLKPAHIAYIGNGLLFAEISTNANQTLDDRWGDANLKCSIIDLNNKTVTDIDEIPVHNGNGGRRFTVLVNKDGFVYYPVNTGNGVFIYRIDPATAAAEKGAEVTTTFVAGFFNLN